MLYQPRQIFNVRENVELGIGGALLAAAGDFISGTNKPWTYYLGTSALATGIPGAAATLYVVGDTVDAIFFKSPDGSDVRIFLNGIATASLDTFAVAAVWETFSIIGLTPGIVNRLDIINYGPSPAPGATGIPWLGLGPVTVNYTSEGYIQGARRMAIFNCSYSIQDADGDRHSVVIPVPRGTLTLPEITGFMEQQAALLDAVIDGKVVEMRVEVQVAVPAGLKANAVANSEVQKGALFTFDLDGTGYAHSIRIPAFTPALFSGNAVNTADADVTALVNSITTGLTISGTPVAPSNPFEFDIEGLSSAKKSFRK
jgi:hypothetical protein